MTAGELTITKDELMTFNPSTTGGGGGVGALITLGFFVKITLWFDRLFSRNDKSDTTENIDVHSAGSASNPNGDDDDNNSDNNKRSLPTKGEPNTDQTLYDKKGNLKQTRHYDSQGNAEYDIDYSHEGSHHKFPHMHWWENGVRQSWVEFEVFN